MICPVSMRGLTTWRTDQIAMALLTVALLAIVLTTYARYGFTTDETRGFYRASRVYAFLSTFGGDRSVGEFGIPNFYGAAPDVLALLLQKLLPVLSYNARHFVFALFGIAGILYVYKFGNRFVSPWTGVFAALFLATTPMWFGYMFINHKDIPFAAMLIASSYYSLVALTALRAPWSLWPKLGVTVGLLATTKIVGIAILGFVLIAFLACFMLLPGAHRVTLNRAFFYYAAAASAAALVGVLVGCLVFWPQLYLFTPKQVFSVVSTFLNFEVWERKVLIFQTIYDAEDIPWYYASVYFFISTPLYLLALAGAGVICAIYSRAPAILAAAFIVVLVFVAQAVTGARIYGGCRHFLFIYPFFMLIAAYPAALMLDAVKPRVIRLAFFGVVGLCVATAVVEMHRLFPYQYSFYNALTGGFAGAEGTFQIEIWKSAEREALAQIEGLVPGNGTVRVYSPTGTPLNIWMFPRLKRVKRLEDADYVVAMRRVCASDGEERDCPIFAFDGLPEVGEVRREGVLLARLYAARPGD